MGLEMITINQRASVTGSKSRQEKYEYQKEGVLGKIKEIVQFCDSRIGSIDAMYQEWKGNSECHSAIVRSCVLEVRKCITDINKL